MVDVFVIGGGPAGLAAALAARAQGLSVTVADAARPPIDKACGEGLMPESLAALRRLGVALEDAEYFPFRGIRFIGGTARVEAAFPQGEALGIRRTELHRIMVARAEAAGVRLLWGTAVRDIAPDGVWVDGETIACRWIVGADGGNSRVRQWAGLDCAMHHTRRFGFRRHYQAAPWTDCMELYWGRGFQVYVTPVAATEVCVAVISPDPRLRLEQALPELPGLAARLAGVPHTTVERGAVTVTRSLARLYSGNTVLVGDASGSVDAVTGEGLRLGFEQALALAPCLRRGRLEPYAAAHRRIARRPTLMGKLMVELGARSALRGRALRALASRPRIFERMLAGHVGCASPMAMAAAAAALGCRMLTARGNDLEGEGECIA